MVNATIILEIMGKPKEHLVGSMEKHLESLGKSQGVTIEKQVIAEAKQVEEIKEQEIFSLFAEIDITTETFIQLTQVMFDFMPTSVEITEPANIHMTTEEATHFMNGLTGRLNQYDQVAQAIQGREKQMVHQFKIAQKLLTENGIIDKEGKILKMPDVSKEEKSEEPKEEKSQTVKEEKSE
ncbi:MAG: hypothetical protein ACI83O_000937 [Patescibacteria group bacterium]|jgi:hypothetical protein